MLLAAGLLAFSAAAQAAAPAGHLQIPAGPGVIAEVDGELSARSQDRYGIIIRDLEPGYHWLVLNKRGARPQRALVQILAGSVTVHQPQPWHPVEKRRRPRATGMLMIQTLPVEATLKSETLGWSEFEKGGTPFRAIARAGRHRITVCNDYRCNDYRIKVAQDRFRSILVDMDRGSVDDLSVTHAARWQDQRQRCAATGDPNACRPACDLDAAFMTGDEMPASCVRLGLRRADAVAVRAATSRNLQAKPSTTGAQKPTE